jgi:hypothetical protein
MTETSPIPQNQLAVSQKRSQGSVSKYSIETWATAEDLVENHPEKTLTEIAVQLKMPLTTLESKSSRAGWLNKRDISKVRKADESLKKIVREVAFQINDLHSHVIAMIEALQYSHRIKIVRDDDGKMHQINFDDYPDRPVNWEELSEEKKEAYRRFIPPARLKAFHEQLHMVLQRQQATIDFTSRMTKAALPKIDPNIVNFISRPAEENDLIDNTDIFKIVPKKEDNLEDSVTKMLDELKGK